MGTLWCVYRVRRAKFCRLFIILYCDLALKLKQYLVYYKLLNSNFLPSIKHDSSRILSRLNCPFSFPLKRMRRLNRHDGNDAFLVWSFSFPYYSATQEYKNNVNRRSCHPYDTNDKNNNLIQLSLMQKHKRAARIIRQENSTHASGLCLRAV